MKKQIIKDGLLGFPLGIAIGYLITILSSLIWADGYYAPCPPELITRVGSEINAVILQTILWGLVGGGFAASSVIWEKDDWSLVKQTGVYFIILSVILLPVAYLTHWMERSLLGILSYLGIFILIFVLVWLIQFGIGRYNVRKMNEHLLQAKELKK